MDLTFPLADYTLQFQHPLLLWGIILIVVLCLWQSFTRVMPQVAILLRFLGLSAIVLALSMPVLQREEIKEKLVALVDLSGSIPKSARSSIAEKLSKMSAPNRTIEVLPFASTSSPALDEVVGTSSASQFESLLNSAAKRLNPEATNIASAFETTRRIAPGQYPIVLFSDGFSTSGRLDEETKRLARLSRPVFPVVLEKQELSQPRLEIASLYAPVTAKAGERETIYCAVRNSLPKDQEASLELWLDNKKLSEKNIRVASGAEAQIQVTTPALEGGLQRIRAVLRGSDSAITTRHRWISVKERSKLLVLHGNEEDKTQLFELIRLKGYSAQHLVADNGDSIPNDLSRFSSVVLNNIAKNQLPKGFLPALESFAKNGGGVLLIGGDRSFGLGGYINSPLEKISPLKFKPPQTTKKRLNVAVALVMDKSGSMGEQNRLLAAKRAAALSVESLKDEDYITIIAFDHLPFLLVDISRVSEAKLEVEKRLRSLTPSGQTNLLPALGMAKQKLIHSRASRKHMIVLSDGQFSNSNSVYLQEINELKREQISVSTVALGSEADLPFLRYLAQTLNGAFHHTLDADRLPEIFVEDIRVATGEETMAERQLFPVGVGPGGLQSTQVKGYPALKGFVETLPKKGSTLELITRRNKGVFPILSSWRYGKGKVAAYTSDANGRWSQRWLRWQKFATFWSDLLEWIRSGTTGDAANIDFDVRYSLTQGVLSVELLVYDDALRSSPPPAITANASAPGNEHSVLQFTPVAPGRFSAEVANPSSGDYRLAIRYGSTDLPPIGITLHDDSFGEQAGRGVNFETLEKIANATGGSLNPDPINLPLSQQKTTERNPLYPYLLALAFALVILEAAMRERIFARN